MCWCFGSTRSVRFAAQSNKVGRMKHEFGIADDTVVVTSTYVTADALPILEVSHEDDEGGSLWQFHCGNGDFDMERMQLVRLDTILRIDPSVVGAAHLVKGEVARRVSKGADWHVAE